MSFDVSKFRFQEGGTWDCSTASVHRIKLWVEGGPDFFDEIKNRQELESLVKMTDAILNQSRDFAISSEYAEDIREAGGIVADSMIVQCWNSIRVWFRLTRDAISRWRMKIGPAASFTVTK